MKLYELDELVKTLCPVHGLNSQGVISFMNEATPEQREAATALVAARLAELEE